MPCPQWVGGGLLLSFDSGTQADGQPPSDIARLPPETRAGSNRTVALTVSAWERVTPCRAAPTKHFTGQAPGGRQGCCAWSCRREGEVLGEGHAFLKDAGTCHTLRIAPQVQQPPAPSFHHAPVSWPLPRPCPPLGPGEPPPRFSTPRAPGGPQSHADLSDPRGLDRLSSCPWPVPPSSCLHIYCLLQAFSARGASSPAASLNPRPL